MAMFSMPKGMVTWSASSHDSKTVFRSMLYSFVGLHALLLQPLRLFSGQQGIVAKRLTNIQDKRWTFCLYTASKSLQAWQLMTSLFFRRGSYADDANAPLKYSRHRCTSVGSAQLVQRIHLGRPQVLLEYSEQHLLIG
jgi:hypothetical protein